jgi:cell wall-associated NlpC family hydrolase
VGVSLPHKANSQKSYGRAISRSQALPGDLIIFLSGGYGYHAAIYAGGGYMYDAPRAGSTVGLHKIWSSTIVFRRLV